MMAKTIPTKKVEGCCQGTSIVVHTNYVGRGRFVGKPSYQDFLKKIEDSKTVFGRTFLELLFKNKNKNWGF